ncbi:LuxR C-terminal-related transcriptional regulator [Scleromatobacter humisilvae]|uniref:LuxR C-terminal-related transcriptional regulator n=1 Tax=Scleromatobacter humisilvae TaxID=2897159 RepID=A0A9X1YKD6_9BURK|nr:LuxR C-terminal-related transcriptional regulator [Scleromatobacter humisilvae]MCK9687312.1 LuxR C-terminal-related transcriptional regulator [Scleromatobacter humisilvae]
MSEIPDEFEQLENAIPLTAEESSAAEKLLEKLREHIQFDAYVLGLGQRNLDGSIEAVRCECVGLPQDFVTCYKAVSHDDVAAQLFSCNATSVLAINVATTYPGKGERSIGSRVGKFLADFGVTHLLLSGIDSRFGLAWLTLYRLNGPTATPFTPLEAETASYLARAGLFEWQLQVGEPVRGVDGKRYELLRLTPAQLNVALRLARGYKHLEVADELDISERTVQDHAKTIYEEFENNRAVAERLLGPLPALIRDELQEARRASN